MGLNVVEIAGKTSLHLSNVMTFSHNDFAPVSTSDPGENHQSELEKGPGSCIQPINSVADFASMSPK